MPVCCDRACALRVLIKWVCDYAFFITGQEIESFLLANLATAASEMSSKLKGRPAENGEHSKSKMENGVDSVAAPALNTYTPEEMVQQMKELITENNELKGECACELVLKFKSPEPPLKGLFCPMSMNSVLVCPCKKHSLYKPLCT